MPAFLGKPNARRPSVFGLTLSIPTRLQTILVACYVGLNVIALCVRYSLFLDNTYYPGDKSKQLTRYVADRAGILAFAYVPLDHVMRSLTLFIFPTKEHPASHRVSTIGHIPRRL
jgi:hypothetical protein